MLRPVLVLHRLHVVLLYIDGSLLNSYKILNRTSTWCAIWAHIEFCVIEDKMIKKAKIVSIKQK